MHMIYLDGVFRQHGRFYPLKGPTPTDLDSITHQVAQRVSRYLEKAGTEQRLSIAGNGNIVYAGWAPP
jgi:hypothetical protein